MRQDEAAARWANHGDSRRAELERRNARLERDAAELERDKAAVERDNPIPP